MGRPRHRHWIAGPEARAARLAAGPEAPEELTLRGLDDVRLLRRGLEGCPSVVVVGGGPLGMEIASGRSGQAAPSPSSRRATHAAAPRPGSLGGSRDRCSRAWTAPRDDKVHADPRPRPQPQVVLDDGSVLEGDMVITAAGDLPNLEFLATSGLLTHGRLEVDSRGRVLVGGRARSDVVAAGDVATFPTGRGTMRVPLWTAAIDQAKVAAPALLLGDGAPSSTSVPTSGPSSGAATSRPAAGRRRPGPRGGRRRPQRRLGPPALDLRRPGRPGGAGAAVAVNYRIRSHACAVWRTQRRCPTASPSDPRPPSPQHPTRHDHDRGTHDHHPRHRQDSPDNLRHRPVLRRGADRPVPRVRRAPRGLLRGLPGEEPGMGADPLRRDPRRPRRPGDLRPTRSRSTTT